MEFPSVGRISGRGGGGALFTYGCFADHFSLGSVGWNGDTYLHTSAGSGVFGSLCLEAPLFPYFCSQSSFEKKMWLLLTLIEFIGCSGFQHITWGYEHACAIAHSITVIIPAMRLGLRSYISIVPITIRMVHR